MSFGAADLYMEIALKEELALLRAKPWRLEYIFASYARIYGVKRLVGEDYVKNCVKMIMTQELTIQPYYTPNVDQYPTLVMAASYGEDQTYLGDFGEQTTGDQLPIEDELVVQPVIYASFDCKKIEGRSMFVSADLKIEKDLWIGIGLINGKIQGTIKSIIVIPGQDTEIETDIDFKSGVTLAGWKAGTLKQPKNVTINGSTDQVTIQMQLKTSGNPDVHRAWAQVIYHCLKRGRDRLDSYGLQNMQMSRSIPSVEDTQSMIMVTNFTARGFETDTWIASEKDPLYRMEVGIRAVSVNPEDEKVPL
jgi:hypothetical protein